MKTKVLWISLALALFLLAFSLPVMGTTKAPDQAIFLPGDKPDLGRPAPFGQYIVTHHTDVVTTTGDYGSPAQTAGYDMAKVLICSNTGTDEAEVDLYGQTTSGGSRYLLENDLATVAASDVAWVPFSHIGPWMTLGITSTGTATVTCAIWAQTP